jgi:hypothetical protein
METRKVRKGWWKLKEGRLNLIMWIETGVLSRRSLLDELIAKNRQVPSQISDSWFCTRGRSKYTRMHVTILQSRKDFELVNLNPIKNRTLWKQKPTTPFTSTTSTMAAFVKAINAKIRANPMLNYVCSTRRFPSNCSPIYPARLESKQLRSYGWKLQRGIHVIRCW